MHRPKADTLKVKWLEELKQEEDLRALTQFTKKYIGIYYKTVTKQFFIKDNSILIT